MENAQLSTVLSIVRSQLGYPTDPTINTADNQRLCQLIADKQQFLADEWDWPTLEDFWDVQVNGGARYLPIPTVTSTDSGTNANTKIAFNKRRPLKVFDFWTTYWNEIEYGIEERNEYNYINSDLGQTNDPIQRWRYSDTTEFEVWPVPNTAQTIRFRGQRSLKNLWVNDAFDLTARLDLDDQMVALFVVADEFAKDPENQAIARSKMSEAMRQMDRVRAQEPRYEKKYVMGSGGPGGRLRRLVSINVPVVAVHG